MTVTSEEVRQDSHEEARCEDTEQHQEEFERRNTRNYELEKLVPFLFDSLPDKGVHFQKRTFPKAVIVKQHHRRSQFVCHWYLQAQQNCINVWA